MTVLTLNRVKLTIPKSIIRSFAALVSAGIVLVALGTGYIWFSGGNGRASAPIAAPHLNAQPNDPRALFRIVPEQSEVLFRIDEMLFGDPNTVVGTTNEVAGDVLLDFDNPSNSQIGLIRINVRTLSTDNAIRNRALRGQILEVNRDEFEFAEFTPTQLLQLPSDITPGNSISFQIEGNLFLHGVTRKIIFDATVKVADQDRIEGNAQATVIYQDFDISIPETPGIAIVFDEVELEITFVATRHESSANLSSLGQSP